MDIPGPRKDTLKTRTESRYPGRQLITNVGLLVASLLIVTAVSEIGLRLFYRDAFAQLEDERTLTYQYDAQLGWFPIPNSTKRFTGFRTISINHNSKGFRDHEPVKTSKPGVIFLGDSLVWGFDVESRERFTDKIQAKHPGWNVHNFGISGYGTDQEYLVLQHFLGECDSALEAKIAVPYAYAELGAYGQSLDGYNEASLHGHIYCADPG